MTGLLPDDANARARAVEWMFAALNTIEPPIWDRVFAKVIEREEWGTTDQPRGDSAAAANNISAAPLDQQLLISPHQLNTGQLHCAAASQS